MNAKNMKLARLKLSRRGQWLIAVALLFTLTACGSFGFSPELSAMSAVRSTIDSNAKMVDNSLVVHQSVKARDNLYVVIMTFNQVRAGTGDETCLYTYEIEKRNLGWSPNSGGGSCWTQDIDTGLPEDIQIGSSQSSSNQPGDPGFSQAYGWVTNPEIVKVRVTWNDGQQEELSVTDSTFVAFRFGLLTLQNLEGLNENGQAIYSYNTQAAPEKTP